MGASVGFGNDLIVLRHSTQRLLHSRLVPGTDPGVVRSNPLK